MEQSQNYGQSGSGGRITPGQPYEAGSALLRSVQQATTIERGLSTFRTGIADILAQDLGGALNQERPEIAADTSGVEPDKVALSLERVEKLNQLYVSLTTDDEVWAEALIANTPLADTTDQSESQTASQAAMA